jgi:hypothetical protein
MNGIKRVMVTVAAASVMVAATAGVQPATASAYSCITNYVCLYDGVNGGSATLYVSCCSSISNLHSGGWGDRATSFYNKTSRRYCLYNDAGYRGAPGAVLLLPGAAGNLTSQWNNKISSMRPC